MLDGGTMRAASSCGLLFTLMLGLGCGKGDGPTPPTDTATDDAFGSARDDSAQGVAVVDGKVFVGGYQDCERQGEGDRRPGKADDCTAFVRRVDPPGAEPIWEAGFGTDDPLDNVQVRAVAADDAYVYVTGQTEGQLLLGCTALGDVGDDRKGNAFLVVYAHDPVDVDGDGLQDCLVYEVFGDPAETDEALGIAINGDDLWVVGGTYGVIGAATAGNEDVFIRHYDVADLAADPPTAPTWTEQMGSNMFEELMAVAATADGVYAVGQTLGNFDGPSNGANDAIVVHLAPDRSFGWKRQVGTIQEDAAQAVSVRVDGGVTAIFFGGRTQGELVAGEQTVGAYPDDAWLMRLDWDHASAPVVVWSHQFGTGNGDLVQAMVSDDDGVHAIGAGNGEGADHMAATTTEQAYVWSFDLDGGTAVTLELGDPDYSDQALGAALTSAALYLVGETQGELTEHVSAPAPDELGFARNAFWIEMAP